MKKLIVIMLLVLTLSMPVFANYPVIDTTAIMNSLMQWEETFQQYAQEINYWTGVTNRAIRAAEGLVSGDFLNTLEAIASLSNQLSTIRADVGVARDVLSGINDDSRNLLDFYRTASGYNIAGFTEAIKNKIENIKSIAEKGTGDWSYGGQSWDNLLNYSNSVFDITSLIANYASGAIDISQSAANFLDELMLVRSPKEKLDALEKQLEVVKLKYGDSSTVSAKIDKLRAEMAKLAEENASYDGEDESKKKSLEEAIARKAEQISELEKVLKLYEDYNEIMAELNTEWVKKQAEGWAMEQDTKLATEQDLVRYLNYESARKAEAALNKYLSE